MAYPNTRTLKYKELGKIYLGTFLEQSRVEVAAENEAKDTLIAEGYSESEAEAITAILKTNEII